MSFVEEIPPDDDDFNRGTTEITEFLPTDDQSVDPRGEHQVFEPSPRIWRLSILLFCLTCGTTFFIGMTSYSGLTLGQLLAVLMNGHPKQAEILPKVIWAGLSYSVPVMSILLAHELGHFLQARRYRVPAIPPLFIPMPIPPFGTMGAVIIQSPHHADRKAMFDIAISGPLAGLCLALPIAWLGIQQSTIMEFDPHHEVQVFGDPLILKWMIRSVHGALPPNHDVVINPLLMAGWVGVFITALNLVPIGQLDGGHVLYCLIGRRAHLVAKLLIAGVIFYMAYAQYWAFAVMVVLMLVMGVNHPPTTNDRVPLGPFRVFLGWLTLAFIVIGINPKPLSTHLPEPEPPQPPGLTVQLEKTPSMNVLSSSL